MPLDQAPPPRIALVVLGMHRSGTSALAGVLGHMGCDLPQDLMPPTEANPRGHFESLKVYYLNDAILASAGSSWDDWTAFNEDWYLSPRFAEFRARAAEVLAEEFGRSSLIVLKDPRICRLLPFWKQVLADAGIRPLFVCTHRAPSEVAASLGRREGWPEARGHLLWLRHVLEAEAGTRGDERIFVSYDSLLSDWRATVQRIAEGLGLHLPRSLETAAPAIDDFLSAELRHFRPGDDRGAASLPDWIREPYRILDRWSAGGEATGDQAALDAIRAEVERAMPMLDMLGRAVESRSKIEEFRSSLTLREQEIAELRGQLASDAAARAALQEELDRARQAQAESEARLRHASQHLESMTRRLAAEMERGLAAQLATRERLPQVERQLADLERQAGDLETELAHARRHIAEMEARHAAMLSSTSWKVTRPMRSITQFLSRSQS